MATVTTNFPTASGPRSRAERQADGVVAGYIRALDGAAARANRPASSHEAAMLAEPAILAGDSLMNLTASRGNARETAQRAASSWSRSARGDCSGQARRLLEAR
jgi:hypothetical protein